MWHCPWYSRAFLLQNARFAPKKPLKLSDCRIVRIIDLIKLSVGQRQRVVIARAIIMQPSLLLADEPTGNLDTHSGKQIMELLESLNAQGLTMLVVTHDPNVARRANRVIVLADGQIVKRFKGKELLLGSMPFPSISVDERTEGK